MEVNPMTNTNPHRWRIPQLRVTFLLLMVTVLLATTSCASAPDGDSLTEVPCPKRPSQRLVLSFGANLKAGLASDERKILTDALTDNALGSKPSTFTVSLSVNGGAAICLDATSRSGPEILKNSQLPTAIGKTLDRLDVKIRALAASTPLPSPTTSATRCPPRLVVLFKAGDTRLTLGAQRQLTRWYRACESSDCTIRIKAYASPDGEKEGLNEGLPEGRAASTRAFLIHLDPEAAARIVSADGRGTDRGMGRTKQEKRRAELTCTPEGTR
jgi:outer membrane protein OmpA-like peptidoglycan-associated protein